MPSRMDAHHGKWYTKWQNLVIIALLMIIVIGVGFVVANRNHHENTSNRVSSSQTQKTETKASKSVVGQGFKITPIKYNGEDVDKAMNENKAPQNTVHDGMQIGYFKNGSKVRITGVPAYFYVHSIDYSVSNGIIKMYGWKIPYTISKGVIKAKQWTVTDSDGNKTTWQLTAYTNAKTKVESHVADSSSESGDSDSTSEDVDQLNLTSDQLEHWVRSYIKSGSQVYNDDDYTFTQESVDGYAEIIEYGTDIPNSNQPIAAYRVNSDGYLEVNDDGTNGEWVVVSQKYS